MSGGDRVTRLQIVVAADQVSIKALRYVLDNLDSLRMLGVSFAAIRVPKEKEKLAPLIKRGITNTPTLVMPDGKLVVGLESIRRIIDKNVQKVTSMRSAASRPAIDEGFTRTGDELNDWMTANILQGAPRGRNGRIAQPQPDDEEEQCDEKLGSDYSARMAQFESRRKVGMPPDPYGNDMNASPSNRRRPPRGNARPLDDEDDMPATFRRNVGGNIDDGRDFNEGPAMGRRGSSMAAPAPRRGRSNDVSPDEMDRMMYDTLMDRNGVTD